MSSQFWQALETTPGRTAVAAEWRALIGKDYDAFSVFLRPSQKLAESYPCPQSPDCGCRHAVIHHGADDIVAVCRCEPDRCEPISLRRTDLVIYEVNVGLLAEAAADAIGASYALSPVNALPSTWNIGTYSPTAGYRFPVYLTIQLQTDEFHQTVAGLCASDNGPFILLAPTHRLCLPASAELLKAKNALFLSLEELLGLDAQRHVIPGDTALNALGEFKSRVLPRPTTAPSMPFFATPPDAKWTDVQICFRDGETVSVRVKKETGVFTFSDMGMADTRSKKPTKQWQLLRDFAGGYGILDWSSRRADRRNQKRREILARDLQAFFRIEGDPIRLTEDGKGWRTLFAVLPE